MNSSGIYAGDLNAYQPKNDTITNSIKVQNFHAAEAE